MSKLYTKLLYCSILVIWFVSSALSPINASTTVVHIVDVHSTYRGNCPSPMIYTGHSSPRQGNCVYPSILRINPEGNWINYISAAKAGVPYTFIKAEFKVIAISNSPFEPDQVITQSAAPDGTGIQTEWPMLYTAPDTEWHLCVLYHTPEAWDDDGIGPNPPAWVHVDEWIWKLQTDKKDASSILDMFHDLPFGSSQTPLVSNESLYTQLKNTYLTEISYFWDIHALLGEATQITELPPTPDQQGQYTGITETQEHPIYSRLYADLWCGMMIDP